MQQRDQDTALRQVARVGREGGPRTRASRARAYARARMPPRARALRIKNIFKPAQLQSGHSQVRAHTLEKTQTKTHYGRLN
eukprot:COSAG02_NODE_5753_length_4064_cov_2.870870_2_plen_81_part_00